MNKVYFRRFQLMARIGILPCELEKLQPIWIDVEFDADVKKAASRDNLADTLDYRKVKEAIEAVVNEKHYYLLETLAKTIVDHLVQNFKFSYLQLHIEKPEVFPDMEAVGVSIVYP